MRLSLAVLFLILVALISSSHGSGVNPSQHLRIVGLQFNEEEPMVRFTGEIQDVASGDKAGIFETFTPIRIGLVPENSGGFKGLKKGGILYCKQKNEVETIKDANGVEVRIHQAFLECHE